MSEQAEQQEGQEHAPAPKERMLSLRDVAHQSEMSRERSQTRRARATRDQNRKYLAIAVSLVFLFFFLLVLLLTQGEKQSVSASPSQPRLNIASPRISSPPQRVRLIERAAHAHALEPALLRALVRVESDFNPDARSGQGALGLTQLLPGTAREMGVSEPLDPEQSLMGGARYLRLQLDRFGSLPLALAAYNAGPSAVIKYGGVPPYRETRQYIQRVEQRLREYRLRARLRGVGAA